MSGGWDCRHCLEGQCKRLNMKTCKPGMKGCTLHGRFVFLSDLEAEAAKSDDKNELAARGAGENHAPVVTGNKEKPE